MIGNNTPGVAPGRPNPPPLRGIWAPLECTIQAPLLAGVVALDPDRAAARLVQTILALRCQEGAGFAANALVRPAGLPEPTLVRPGRRAAQTARHQTFNLPAGLIEQRAGKFSGTAAHLLIIAKQLRHPDKSAYCQLPSLPPNRTKDDPSWPPRASSVAIQGNCGYRD